MKAPPVLLWHVLWPFCLASALIGCGGPGRDDALQIIHRKIQEAGNSDHKHVVAGIDGTLFYLGNLTYVTIPWMQQGRWQHIPDAAQHVQDMGIHFVAVLVPTKLEVYPERLIGFDVEDLCGQRQAFLDSMRARDVTILDLLPVFRDAKERAELYAQNDTHWSSAGVRLTAREIATHIRSHFPEIPVDRDSFLLRDTTVQDYDGDLARKYPHIFSSKGVTERAAMVLDSVGQRYRDDPNADVFIFGDSFAGSFRHQTGHLSAHVARELGRPVGTAWTLANITGSPDKIRRILEGREKKPKVLVWAFLTRNLMD